MILSIFVFLGACSPKNAKVMEDKKETSDVHEDAVKQQKVESPKPKPAFVAAGIKRTPCYGKCQVYEINFYAKGYATYEGKSNVKKMGKYRADLDRAQARIILEKAQEAGYFEAQSAYPADGKIISDFPYTITYVEFGEERKEIKNNYDAPQSILDFEAYLDEVASSLDWKEEKGQ
jgi:hypothetical protein